MDEIIISVAGEDYAPVKETNLNVHNFNDLSTTPKTNSLTAACTSVLTSPKNMVHSGTSSRGTTTYQGEIREGDDKALVVTTEASAESNMVHQPKRHFAGYVEEDGKEYIIATSYEIYVPEASKEAQRKHTFSFSGRNNSNADFSLASYIKNGKLTFKPMIVDAQYAELVDFTERTKTATVSLDEWNTINYIMKIKYDTTNKLYDITVYGMYKDVCYYEGAFKVNCDTSTNTNGLYMVVQGFGITDLEDKVVVTRYDNVKISSYSAMPEITYAWAENKDYIYPLALNSTASSVEAKAKVLGNYANLCLVTAVFNNDGALVDLWTDNTLDGGYLSYTVTGSNYVKSGYTVKAFLFDSLTYAIPQVEKAEITIE